MNDELWAFSLRDSKTFNSGLLSFDLFALAPLFAQPESEEALCLQIHYVTFLAGQSHEVYLRAGKPSKKGQSLV